MIARTNNRTLLLLIMVLLVTNGIMLYLLTKTEEKPKEPELSRTERSIKMVQDALSLDSIQVNQYLALRGYRDSLLAPRQSEMRAHKNAMMKLLRVDSIPNDSVIAAAKRIGDTQAQIEVEYFTHFRRMIQLLNPDQQPKFDTLIYKMVNRSNAGQDSQTPKSGSGDQKN
jgi:Spy/CpxP family protein refolding chaperone